MKNYEEMAKDVLSRVSEYESEQKLKRARRTRIAAAATPVCAAAVIGAGIWGSGALMHADKPAAPADSSIISETVTVTKSSKPANSGSSSAAVTEKTTRQEEQEETTGATSEEATARAGAPWKPSVGESDEETSEPAKQTEAATQRNSAETTAAVKTTSAPKTTAVANTTAAPRTTAAVTTQPNSGNGPMLSEGEDPPQYRTIIQSYPFNASEDMDAPKEGTFAIAYPVTMAMREYGDDADYRVHVELFKGGNGGNISDYASLLAESKRLYGLGYISGVEGYTNNGYTTYFLWIQATREQVKNFQPSSEYGYILMFPYSNQGTSETVAFNGIDY